MTTPIDKPVALVTGSARGIGRAIALHLASLGHAVLVNGRNPDPADRAKGAYEVLDAIEAAGGVAHVVRGDVSVPADRESMVAAALERFGRLDLLVNNAGVGPRERTDILEASPAIYDEVLDVNLKGPYFLTQLAAKAMIECQKAGIVARPRIAFITSISVFASSTNRGEYCISKAGLAMAAQLWADRLGEFDIPVIEIRPGVIATDMTFGVKEKYDKLIADGIFVQKRWGQPDDIARAVGAFARGDLDYCTGAVIDVSGGFQLKRL